MYPDNNKSCFTFWELVQSNFNYPDFSRELTCVSKDNAGFRARLVLK